MQIISGFSPSGESDDLAAHFQLAERVGHVARHRIGAAARQDVDRLGFRQQRRPPGRASRRSTVRAIVASELSDAAEESVEDAAIGRHRHCRRRGAAQALLIGGIALAQAFAEYGLQAGETREAEMLGEADQRRGLNARRGRDARRRAEGDLVRDCRANKRPPARSASASECLRSRISARSDFIILRQFFPWLSHRVLHYRRILMPPPRTLRPRD